jgi:hypothetical protein
MTFRLQLTSRICMSVDVSALASSSSSVEVLSYCLVAAFDAVAGRDPERAELGQSP